MPALLSITGLHTSFEGPDSVAHAVNGVSLSIENGQTVALVGESGSGKSMTALSIIRLVPPPGRITSGTIKLEGSNLLDLSDREMRMIRGSRISMVFQEPMTSLNPVLRIGDQVTEPLILHRERDVVRRGMWSGKGCGPERDVVPGPGPTLSFLFCRTFYI